MLEAIPEQARVALEQSDHARSRLIVPSAADIIGACGEYFAAEVAALKLVDGGE